MNKKKKRTMRRGLGLAFAVCAICFTMNQTALGAAPCIQLTSNGLMCVCKADEHMEKCACKVCVGGVKCACIEALKKESGTIAGVVSYKYVKKYPTLVYIDKMPGKKFPAPEKPFLMDQKGKVFLPRVLPVLVGSKVDFLNSDSFDHNVFSPDGEKYDLGKWGQGKKRAYTFKEPGVYVQLCRIHPEMVAYVVVLETPYFAQTDKTGKFTIPGVPPGAWKVKVWNERMKSKQTDRTFEVTSKVGETTEMEISFLKKAKSSKKKADSGDQPDGSVDGSVAATKAEESK